MMKELYFWVNYHFNISLLFHMTLLLSMAQDLLVFTDSVFVVVLFPPFQRFQEIILLVLPHCFANLNHIGKFIF